MNWSQHLLICQICQTKSRSLASIRSSATKMSISTHRAHISGFHSGVCDLLAACCVPPTHDSASLVVWINNFRCNLSPVKSGQWGGGGAVGDPWIKMSYRIIIISAAICCRKVPDRLTPPLVILTREDNPRGNWPTEMSTWKRVMGIKSSASSGGSFFLVLPFIIRNGEWKRERWEKSNETRR